MAENVEQPLPGGEIGARELHFIWILDTSGSMAGEKIAALNFAVRETIPALRKRAASEPRTRVMVRVITFSTGAQWHVVKPVPLEDFTWSDVQAGGLTAMGAAMRLLADQMKTPPMPKRGAPPAFVLVSDGHPTDGFKTGLKELLKSNWAAKAIRCAVGIGDDCDFDALNQFIGPASREQPALHAKNSSQLAQYIQFASTTAMTLAAASPSHSAEAGKADSDDTPKADGPELHRPANPDPVDPRVVWKS